MRWPVNPLRGKTTDWRAVCGRSACTVRRGEGPNSIKPSYPYPGLLYGRREPRTLSPQNRFHPLLGRPPLERLRPARRIMWASGYGRFDLLVEHCEVVVDTKGGLLCQVLDEVFAVQEIQHVIQLIFVVEPISPAIKVDVT